MFLTPEARSFRGLSPENFVTPPRRPNPESQAVTPEMVYALGEMLTKGLVEANEKNAGMMQEFMRSKETTDSFYRADAKDFKDSFPTIEDKDSNLDHLDMMFENMIATMSIGGKQPRDIDKLHMYRKSFKEGSLRRKVDELELRKAVLAGRDREAPLEVLETIRKRLRSFITVSYTHLTLPTTPYV